MKLAICFLSLSLLLYVLAIFNVISLLWPDKWLGSLGSSLSILSGFVSGVIGFYLARFVGEPIVEWNQLRAEVANTIIFYQDLLLSNDPGLSEQRSKGRDELRGLATKVRGVSQIIRMRLFVETIFSIPTLAKASEASKDLLGLSNKMFQFIRSEGKSPHEIERDLARKQKEIYDCILSLETILQITINDKARELSDCFKKRIEICSNIIDKSIVWGTQMAVALILQKLAAGETINQVLQAHL